MGEAQSLSASGGSSRERPIFRSWSGNGIVFCSAPRTALRVPNGQLTPTV